jgi:hypothetical protein
MKKIYDVNVKSFKPLISPPSIKEKLPIPDDGQKQLSMDVMILKIS